VVSAVASLGLAHEIVAAVPDPELPGLTIGDLGILRTVQDEDGTVVVILTPTYTGCPALAEILTDVRAALARANFDQVDIRISLQPPWTTEWITTDGRRKLAAAGIAPPGPVPSRIGPVPIRLGAPARVVSCPLCRSRSTTQQSRFGATACRALYRCDGCGEPFEYLKEI
jgi:ring-1,2-phenylacetyl-CoA epoxidase subunit PaaD